MDNSTAVTMAAGALATSVVWWYVWREGKTRKRAKVVVIGGGFAGVEACAKLQHNCDVVLVDCKNYHEYTPE